MCNVPCSICGDFYDCEIISTPVEFRAYRNGNFCGYITCTKKCAEELTFQNKELTLILETKDEVID